MTDLVWQRGAEPKFGDRRASSHISQWRRATYLDDTLTGELLRLGRDWTVLRGDHCGGLPLDIILIGPAGIIAVDASIRATRNIWVGEHDLLINGIPRDTVSSLREAALTLSSTLTVNAGEIVNVTPIIVVPGGASIEFGGNSAMRTAAVQADRFAQWLAEAPTTLSPQAVSYFSMVAEERDTWLDPAVSVA